MKFIQPTTEELSYLRPDPLLWEQELDVRPDMPDAELASIVAKIKQLPIVDDVETYQKWTDRLARLVRGGVGAAGRQRERHRARSVSHFTESGAA